MANRFAFFVALLLLTAAQVFLAMPLITVRLTEPFWWPLLAMIPVWATTLWRRSTGGFTISLKFHSLIALSVLALVVGLLRGSAWLGAMGIWLLAVAIGTSVRDQRGASAPLWYSIPWLLLAGMPTRWAASGWLWLMTQISRTVLLDAVNRGHFVWTEGTALITKSGALDPGTICNSAFALGGLAALAWLLCVVRRRSLPQALLVLILSVVCGITFAAGIAWVALGQLNAGATAGTWTEVLWNIGLAGAGVGFLLLSDLFVTAFTAPIPSRVNGNGHKGNPIAELWNHWISSQPVDVGSGFSSKGLGASIVAVFASPLRSGISDSLWAWWYSRSLPRLATGVPLLGLAIAGLVAAAGRSDSAAMAQVQSRLDAAVVAGQIQDQEYALRTLISLQPRFGALKLRLAELFRASGRTDACLEQVQPLTTDGDASYAPARLWLVRNSLMPKPLLPLTDDDRVKQLLKVLEADPDNAEAYSLLAKAHLNLGEVSLAERAFVDAANRDSSLNLQLLQFCRTFNRQLPDADRFDRRLQSVQQQYREDPKNVTRLLELVRLQLIMGRVNEAFDNVASARSTSDSEELRRLEAEVRIVRVGVNTGSAFLRMQQIIDDTRIAMQLAPGFTEALSLAVTMKITEGAEFGDAVVRRVLDYWQHQEGSDDAVRTGQGLALVLAEDYAAAVERMQSMTRLQPDQHLALIYALQRCGRIEQAAAAADAAVASLGPLQILPLRRQAVHFYAAAGSPERGLDAVGRIGQTPDDQQVRGLVSLLQFDQLSGYPGDMSLAAASWRVPATTAVEKMLSLLKDALLRNSTQSAAARRLYRVRRSAVVTQRAFDRWLFEVRAELGSPEQMLLVVGTMALNEEAWQDALYWLDAAVQASRVAPQAAMNNLAIAIVRSGVRDRYPEALTLVNEAFETSPENPDLLASRGEVSIALEQWKAARVDLERVLVLQPEHPDAIRLLPTVYAALVHKDDIEALRQTIGTKNSPQ